MVESKNGLYPKDIPGFEACEDGKRKMVITPGITGAEFPCTTTDDIQRVINSYATSENIEKFLIRDLED